MLNNFTKSRDVLQTIIQTNNYIGLLSDSTLMNSIMILILILVFDILIFFSQILVPWVLDNRLCEYASRRMHACRLNIASVAMLTLPVGPIRRYSTITVIF